MRLLIVLLTIAVIHLLVIEAQYQLAQSGQQLAHNVNGSYVDTTTTMHPYNQGGQGGYGGGMGGAPGQPGHNNNEGGGNGGLPGQPGRSGHDHSMHTGHNHHPLHSACPSVWSNCSSWLTLSIITLITAALINKS